tara:strand:+ start:1746 stop:1991 length:246 start_codon:yes stop_codon:yes gene_type:complete
MSENSKLHVSSLEWQRDQKNQSAVVSVDGGGLLAYKRRKALLSSRNNQIDKMSADINSLKEDMTELKNVLMQVMNSLQQEK